MDLVLKKKLPFIKPFGLNLLLLRKLSSLSPATRNPSSPKSSSFIAANYLIESCGLSPHKAATASKKIATLTSAERPDSVRHFLRHLGCSDANIRSIVSSHPDVLKADVERSVKPNLEALRGSVQLSEPQFLKLVVSAPRLLTNPRTLLPRLDYWKDFIGGDVKKLVLAVTRNRGLITSDINTVTPKIALLRKHGLSKGTIVRLLSGSRTGVCVKSVSSLELLLKRVQELGFPRDSSMFMYGLATLSTYNADCFKAKVDIFKSYGWSDEEFLSAFKKYPFILTKSKECIQKKMEFLVRTAGCSQSYIVSRPVLLSCSLEKRLIPRFRVISFLKMNKSINKEPNLLTVMRLSEENFVEKFILPYKEIEPKLLETYADVLKVEPHID